MPDLAEASCRRCGTYVEPVAYEMSMVKFGAPMCASGPTGGCYPAASKEINVICSLCGASVPGDDPTLEQAIRHHHRLLCPNCYTKPASMAGPIMNKNSSLYGQDPAAQEKLRAAKELAINARPVERRPDPLVDLPSALSALAEAYEQERLTDEEYQEQVAAAMAAAGAIGTPPAKPKRKRRVRCECCKQLRDSLPFAHDFRDIPGHTVTYCRECNDAGCDLLTCSL